MMNSATNAKKYDDQKVAKKICRYGEAVFTKSWSAGQPGSDNSCDSVFEWNGRFATIIDGEVFGPYVSLRAVLKAHDYWFLLVSQTTESFECNLLKAEALAKMLFVEAEPDSETARLFSADALYPPGYFALFPRLDQKAEIRFTINGETWTRNGSGFVRA